MSKGSYRVLWSQSARSDLEAIIEYIALDKNEAALQVLKKIRKTVSKLGTFPQRGRLIPELKEQGITLYRELIIPPWRVIYRIAGKSVLVLAGIDSRRNVEDILLERLNAPGIPVRLRRSQKKRIFQSSPALHGISGSPA